MTPEATEAAHVDLVVHAVHDRAGPRNIPALKNRG